MLDKFCELFPVLETERLRLKPIEDRDADHLYNILSDEEVAKFEYFYPIKSIEEASKFIQRYKDELKEGDEITWGFS